MSAVRQETRLRLVATAALVVAAICVVIHGLLLAREVSHGAMLMCVVAIACTACATRLVKEPERLVEWTLAMMTSAAMIVGHGLLHHGMYVSHMDAHVPSTVHAANTADILVTAMYAGATAELLLALSAIAMIGAGRHRVLRVQREPSATARTLDLRIPTH